MRIQHNPSFSTTRPHRRQSGCMPLFLVMGILIGVVIASWDWLGARFNLGLSQQSTNLRTASEAFDRGDLDATITQARHIWTTQPYQVDALILLIRALIYRSYTDYDRDSDRDIALQLATEAVQRLPENLDALALHALALQAGNQPVEAINVALTVLERQPDNILARVTLALSYGSAGNHQAAWRELQAIETAADWQLDIQRALAISLSDLGQYHAAIAAVEQALALNHKLPLLHFERALYAMQVGDTDAATASYFRILAFDPDNVKVRLRLCELSIFLREHDSAVTYCEEVIERAPGWAEGWYHLGREYFLHGDFASAQRHLNRCTALQTIQNMPIAERQFECWYLQGQAAEIQGDCDGLLATYNEFRAMAAEANLPQTWTYPPEGPPICTDLPGE